VGLEAEAAMSIAVQCPGCGKTYALDETYAGKRVACKQGGQAMRVGVAAAVPRGSTTMVVACANCGKEYTVASEFAGKKTACTRCGTKFRIPAGGAAATVRSEDARRPSEAAPAPEAPAPATAPWTSMAWGRRSAPASERRRSARRTLDLRRPCRRGFGPAPSTAEALPPLSAAEKKKIAKRADKIDRSKSTTATVGVSFGTVLLIALFGWRVQRMINRGRRAAERINAAQTAPAELVDHRVMLATLDKQVAAMIAEPTTAEAGEWLDPVKYPNHAVMEMPIARAREMVAGFYQRGAEKVYVLEPEAIGNRSITAQFAVKLPQDPAQRKQCLQWQAKCEGEEQPDSDRGQKYLLITTD
jgi:DNA-directed RNA polymerase subunit RPC12/RpoP